MARRSPRLPPGSNSGPPMSFGRAASIGTASGSTGTRPARRSTWASSQAASTSRARWHASAGRLGIDPGDVRVEAQALDRQGQPGGRLRRPGAFRRGVPGGLVDPVDLAQPAACRVLDRFARRCRGVGVAEREPGGLLGGADLARVGEQGRLGRAQGKLVVGPLLLAEELVGRGRLLPEAIGQVAALDRDPPFVGARAGQRDGCGGCPRRIGSATGLGLRRTRIARARLGGAVFGRALGNRDSERRRRLESLPERIELLVPLAGDRERDEGAADQAAGRQGWNDCSSRGGFERRSDGQLAGDTEGDRIGRSATSERRGERPVVVDGQGRGPPLGQGVGRHGHPDLTRRTGSDVHDGDE